MKRLGFSINAMAGHLVVILLFVVGLAFTVSRLDGIAGSTAARIRQEQTEILLAERMRWNAERIVSAGRGYLVSGNRLLLDKLTAARARFERCVRELRATALDDEGAALLDEVEAAATEYERQQERVLAARTAITRRPDGIAERFKAELWPDRISLATALDHFVSHKEAAIAAVHAGAERERARVVAWTSMALGALVLLALGVAWYFATQLTKAYRREHEAHLTARRASAARDELMGIVAHDLRSPLGAITMNADILASRAESAAMRARAATIENVALRMEHLIRSMLDVTVLESGQLTIDPAHHDVERMLRETVELYEGPARTKRIAFECSVRPAGLAVHADRDRVLQVLANLVGNALKFTPESGRISLSAERQGEAMVRFAVRDSGSGIEPAHLPHIFDRFWKHERSEHSGTGLGLFIAKGIVDAHGGQIWVENVSPSGAAFYFTLPLAEPSSAIAAPESPAIVSLRPGERRG